MQSQERVCEGYLGEADGGGSNRIKIQCIWI